MNKVILIGRVGKDPEVKYMPDGNMVTNFSLATNAGKEKTDWHNITAYKKQAEIAGNYLKKGSHVSIVGKINYQEWEKDGVKKYKTEIIAYEIEMLGKKETQQPQPTDDVPF